jgi:hypothetical protein
MEIKKDVGVKSLRAYPNYQALALPLSKDKQRKASPRRVIIRHPRRGLMMPYVYIHR